MYVILEHKLTLALFRPLEFTVKLHIMELAWSLVILKGQKLEFLKYIVFLSLKIDIVLANSTHPDEMLPNAAFQLSLHCKYTCLIPVARVKRVKYF